MKPRNRWVVISLTMMTAIVTGCNLNDNPEEPEIPDGSGALKLTRAELEMVNHSNDFSFNLFKQIIDSRSADESLKKQSIIVSPISITYALGMLNNGAAGNTQKQINTALGFGSTGTDNINDFCLKMLKSVPALDSKTKIMIANNIYLNKEYKLYSDFINKANTYYYAYPETRDFHDGMTMDVINKWASDHTDKMIQKILDEKSFNPDAVSYLLNAIYFKGEWTNKFDINYTVEEDFWRSINYTDATTCPMMHMTTELEYGYWDGYQVLRLPYGNKSFQMTILLPDASCICYDDAIPDPQDPLFEMPLPSAETWSQINSKMSSYLIDLKLPRFETTTDIELPKIMAALGMPDAFNPDKADFSKFCKTPTYIGLMKQVARIKLDEEGTEATAVTVIGMDNTAVSKEPKIIYFHANHPFIYIISESSSNAIFFIGQYTGY